MKYKIFLASLLLVVGLLALAPKTASAFWWFGQKKATTTVKIEPQGLNDQEKTKASAKYKLWFDGFEKKNVETIINNRDKFSFTVSEINYLLDTESKKVKKPTLTSASITSSNGNINLAANFHKFISGRFSFVAKIVPVDNKIRLKLSAAKLYGISIPVKWLEEPINEELDKYFAFLYKDSRYQGFSVDISDSVLQIKPEFK